jgi:hypothetical protein
MKLSSLRGALQIAPIDVRFTPESGHCSARQ